MKMNLITPRLPSGFIEYLPAEQIEFNRLLDIIRRTYEKYGFAPLDTPVMELSEVLLAKGGGETEKQIYRFERGKNDLSLRFDLTVPLARYVAQHQGQLTFPFRRYQIGKVYRAERAQAGRFREFYQCDIDTIGSTSTVIDAEFPAIINDIFEQFAFGDFTIRLNNRKVLNGFFEGLGLADASADVLRVIDKMEKITEAELVAELQEIGLSAEQVGRVLEFTAITGSNDEIIAALNKMPVDSLQFSAGTGELLRLIEALRLSGVPENRFKIDLRIARGLDYYTGTVYETVLNDYPQLGSVCSGGRYDDLASNYSKTELPGVGVSIGLTRLFYKLMEAGIINPTEQTLAPVVVLPFSEEQLPSALETATKLRKAGWNVITNTESADLGKRLKYVDKIGSRYAVVIGGNEVTNGTLAVKDMARGENVQMTFDDLLLALANLQ
jgi:histidyl-tRNA synthetase